MELKKRIDSFISLGKVISGWLDADMPENHILSVAVSRSSANNPWFTRENQAMALRAIKGMISDEVIHSWLAGYFAMIRKAKTIRTVAVVMAGNIPLAGFHDFLCVLLTGHRIVVKCSKDDPYLLPCLIELLTGIDSRWSEMITLTEGTLPSFEAIIATGGNNTSRYFEYYFGKVPHIIRHHRNSVAVISGREDEVMLQGIAHDIMSYFGLGCRNVSKIFVPENYELNKLTDAFLPYRKYLDHNKYRNNFDYNSSLLILNRIPFCEILPLLLIESDALSSRIGMLHYSYYHDIKEVVGELNRKGDEIQCVVCHLPILEGCVAPGKAQFPGLDEFADGVDTLLFLSNI